MRILLCTDGSTHGQAALRFGARLAQNSPEPATLLGVLEEPGERAQLEQALEAGKQWLAGAAEPQIKVRVGHPAEEILDEAHLPDYDLIVVGARGRRGITRFLLGSTSERIARHASVPVLIVRGERKEMKRTLICTSGAAPGLAVVQFGGRVARLAGAEVTVLHVMSQLAATPMLPPARAFQVMPQTPDAPELDELQLEDLESPAEALIAHDTREGRHLKEALEILSGLDVPARALVRHGLVVDEVTGEACEGDYDLVVVGTHGRQATGWMRLLLNDVGHQIIGCCPDRSMLIVPSQGGA